MSSEFHSKQCNVNWCFEGSALQDYFLIRFLSDHNEISMANANIDALYAASLRIRVSYFFSEKFYTL